MTSCDRATPTGPGTAPTHTAPTHTAPITAAPVRDRLTRLTTLFFAVAAGIAVSNVYFAQPLLVSIGQDFGLSAGVLGLVVTATQVGYGVGLFLLVPLGDMVNRRRLIVAQFGLMAIALLAAGAAPNALVLLAGMAAVGLLAVVTQALVAFAAALARPERRGRVVGTVTSGVVIGILSARAVSGALADLAGWRAVYFASAALVMVIAVAAHRVLPRGGPAGSSVGSRMPYRRLLGSTVALLRQERTFRLRGTLALLTFGAFSTLWSCLALPLSAPPLSLSHTAIGAFGLIGVAGALAAVPAGRLNDRGHARWTTGGALILLTLSWLPIGLAGHSLWALAGGVVLLDLAVQTVHVTNQSLILELAPDAGSRLIGGYMIFYSVGSGVGAIASTAAYAFAGWTAVAVLGAALSLLALLLWAATQRVSLS